MQELFNKSRDSPYFSTTQSCQWTNGENDYWKSSSLGTPAETQIWASYSSYNSLCLSHFPCCWDKIPRKRFILAHTVEVSLLLWLTSRLQVEEESGRGELLPSQKQRHRGGARSSRKGSLFQSDPTFYQQVHCRSIIWLPYGSPAYNSRRLWGICRHKPLHEYRTFGEQERSRPKYSLSDGNWIWFSRKFLADKNILLKPFI